MTAQEIVTENIFMSSICIAIAVPCGIIVLGFLIEAMQKFVIRLLALAIGQRGAAAFVNYVLFPGVVVHECAHALMVILTGAKLQEVKLFSPDSESLGHVSYANRGGRIQRAVQDFLIASAPMYIGAAILIGCDALAQGENLEKGVQYIMTYLELSVLFHMTMSKEDRAIFVKGIPLFMLILFPLVLCIRAMVGN